MSALSPYKTKWEEFYGFLIPNFHSKLENQPLLGGSLLYSLPPPSQKSSAQFPLTKITSDDRLMATGICSPEGILQYKEDEDWTPQRCARRKKLRNVSTRVYIFRQMLIPKFRSISGLLIPPGDKSISHRAAIVAAISEGRSILKNFLRSDDTDATLTALTQLGVEIRDKKGDIEITGVGLKGLKKSQTILDLKNSGTSLRCLTGLLSAHDFPSILTGDESLRRRPMGELARLLSSMGGKVRAEKNAYAPICIDPIFHRMNAISYDFTSPSAQFKTALLLAGLYASGEMKIFEPVSTRDHTERLFQKLGISLKEEGGYLKMEGGGGEIQFSGAAFDIPGDLSAASFFIAAALLLPDSGLDIKSVGLNPTRTGFIDIIRAMGGDIKIEMEESEWEPRGTIRVTSSHLRGIRIEESLTIRAIDEIPLVALLATQAEGTTEIFGIEPSLRFKESNRIAAICEGLGRMGANVQEGDNCLLIEGHISLEGAVVQSYSDHRMAMMFFIAAQIARGGLKIDDLSSISVSFPNFMVESLSLFS